MLQIQVTKDLFILISEGPKEENLQVATKYIIDNNISADYIIRLDDDDLFNTKNIE